MPRAFDLRFLPPLSAALLSACEPIRTADYLDITFAGPAQVDINCGNGGCDTINSTNVTVTWAEDPLFLSTDQIEIAQYRVDYDIPGVDGEVPFYAGYTSQFLNPGGTITFGIVTMGQTQRTLIAPTVSPGETVIASATLTLGGWDHNGDVIGDEPDEGAAPFELWLADFSTFATDDPTTDEPTDEPPTTP